MSTSIEGSRGTSEPSRWLREQCVSIRTRRGEEDERPSAGISRKDQRRLADRGNRPDDRIGQGGRNGRLCPGRGAQIGGASCRERVCQYMSSEGVAGAIKKKR